MKESKPHYTVGEILKKISISRGAPKKKYPSKVTVQAPSAIDRCTGRRDGAR
jgi:hypothetical protein